MNTPEKIAATYLRLNGFLLLPHFTVFIAGAQHNHVDLIGYRPRNSEESVSNVPLERDEEFSSKIKELQNDGNEDSSAGIIVQVRGNKTCPDFFEKHDEYIAKFLGSIKPVRVIFHCQKDNISIKRGDKPCICISLKHSYKWIQDRISWIRKAGSWELSEEFLADLLFIRYKISS